MKRITVTAVILMLVLLTAMGCGSSVSNSYHKQKLLEARIMLEHEWKVKRVSKMRFWREIVFENTSGERKVLVAGGGGYIILAEEDTVKFELDKELAGRVENGNTNGTEWGTHVSAFLIPHLI